MQRREQELAYYRRQVDELAGENVRLDYTLSALRYDLKQQRQGYALLAALQKISGVAQAEAEVFEAVCSGVQTELGMERAVVLTPAEAPGAFRVARGERGPAVASSGEAAASILVLPPGLVAENGFLLVNKATEPTPLVEQFREALGLPYFVGVPVIAGGTAIGFLVAGRMREALPFSPPLGEVDVDTLHVVAGLIAAKQRDREFTALHAEHERRAIELEKAQELGRAYAQLEASHRELKATQAKLAHQEKLASLGRLTAGIAHEIKNPLNFVINFAMLSVDLAEELRAVVDDGDTDEVEGILSDLKANATTIAENGRRADAIVRGMMEHARGGSSQHERVDLNRFVEGYVDLAWHGRRATAPGFEVAVDRAYEEAAGAVDVAPQELGRVLINLLSNAFDAVEERAAGAAGPYVPTVRVATRREGEHVEVHIADNGPGIPEPVRARIFEPFFTTKPAGAGIGLGLSLAYDIVTQGHGGTLSVESEENEGARFVITLPVFEHEVEAR